MGSAPGLIASSNCNSESLCPLVVRTGIRWTLLYEDAGVRRPVGSPLEYSDLASSEAVGDPRLDDLLLPDRLSFELSEPPRLRGLTSRGFCRLWFDGRPFDGTSFRNEINTDSSIRL